jgi:hypothetical protein
LHAGVKCVCLLCDRVLLLSQLGQRGWEGDEATAANQAMHVIVYCMGI